MKVQYPRMKLLTIALFTAVVSSASITDTLNSTNTITLTTCFDNSTTYHNSTSVSYTPSVPSVSEGGASQMKFIGIAAILAGAMLAL